MEEVDKMRRVNMESTANIQKKNPVGLTVACPTRAQPLEVVDELPNELNLHL